ncbi:MAG: metallophosphoesterase [Propionibacteriaceae bacterium]
MTGLTPPAPRRVAVIGDVAGHLDELRTELVRLGADAVTLELPPGLLVIQVGDLIHRGPDSTGVVRLVDRYLSDQPAQWVQLVGNHEAQYLRQPAFDWPEKLPTQTAATLQHWWAHGQLRAAAAISAPTERFLVTHAGLTRGFWTDVLDRFTDPAKVAAALNSLIGTHEDVLFSAGQMLGGRRPDRLAGPVWASAGTELLPSWFGHPLPFSQVHGHASAYDWTERRFRTSKEIARATDVDEQAKHATVTFDGGRIVGIDPGHSHTARRPWRGWEISLDPDDQPAASVRPTSGT